MNKNAIEKDAKRFVTQEGEITKKDKPQNRGIKQKDTKGV